MLEQINSLMPKDIQFTKADYPLTKKKMQPKLVEFARRYPALYAKNIHKIRMLGEETAYRTGHHVGLNDLFLPNQKEIDKKINAAHKIVQKSDPETAKKILIKTFDDVQNMTMKNKDNHIVMQAASGGRGKPQTAARTAAGVIFAVDMNSQPYPFMIKNSLAKGLRSHEQFASGGQARYAAVQTAVSTSEPGAMGKVLVANTEHLKITMKDCGTKNGIEESVDDPSIIGRYEARTNKLITPAYIKELKRRGKKHILVRSPITCEAKDGVCAMCYGNLPNGKLPEVGHNIGIEAAQTVSEKATQLVLSTKHAISGKTKSNIPTGFKAQKILLNPPEKFQGKATLAFNEGKVDYVKELPVGGYKVSIAGVEHHIGHDVVPLVKPGDMVHKGQKISTGLASTKDVFHTQGVLKARKYLANQLHKEGGGSIDKRVYEVISRGYLDLVKDKNEKSNEHLYRFDGYIKNTTPPNTYMVKISDPQITNKFLVDSFESWAPGARVTDEIVKKAKEHGIKELKVSHNPMPYTPVFKTYEMKPLAVGSVWQKINYRNINKSLKNALLFEGKTNVHKLHSDRAKYTLGVL